MRRLRRFGIQFRNNSSPSSAPSRYHDIGGREITCYALAALADGFLLGRPMEKLSNGTHKWQIIAWLKKKGNNLLSWKQANPRKNKNSQGTAFRWQKTAAPSVRMSERSGWYMHGPPSHGRLINKLSTLSKECDRHKLWHFHQKCKHSSVSVRACA